MVANTDWLLCNKNYAFSPKRYSLGLASISRACALTFFSPYHTSTFPTVTCTNSRQKATGNSPGELLHWFINEPTTTKHKRYLLHLHVYMDGLKKHKCLHIYTMCVGTCTCTCTHTHMCIGKECAPDLITAINRRHFLTRVKNQILSSYLITEIDILRFHNIHID